MMWMLPAVGALGGALMNKKDPLKGALLGGGLGLAGGAALPYLGAGAGSAGAGGLLNPTAMGVATEAMTGGVSPAIAAQMAGNPALAAPLASGAYTGGAMAKAATTPLSMMDKFSAAAKPIGQAMGVANQVKGMMPQDQPIPQAPAFSSGGPAPMTNFYSQMQANKMAQGQNDMMRKQRRQSLIG